MLAFLAVLFIALAVYIYMGGDQPEGFVVADSKLNIPTNVVKPTASPGGAAGPRPAQLPGPLMAGPYEQIARNTPIPYQDPALLKTNRARVLQALEAVKGFLAFEAQEIQDSSDPSIQLPLTTARGDFATLEDQARVLQRNPGLQPDLTEAHIAEIESNLAYLQRKVRLIGMNRPFGDDAWDKLAGGGPTRRPEGFENPGVGDAPGVDAAATQGPADRAVASEAELRDFSQKLLAEITRLRASGTNDPITVARVGNLNGMMTQVDDILAKLQSGAMLPEDVPILSADIRTALPILGDPTQALPQIVRRFNLPPAVASLLPAGVASDPEVSRQVTGLLDKYAEDFLKGVSAAVSFKVKYTPERELEIAKAKGDKGVANTGFPTAAELKTIASAPAFMPVDQGAASDTGLPGIAALAGSESHELLNPPRPNPSWLPNPARFDWKKRAKEIENQIRLRDLNPSDFGVMRPGAAVPTDFSWRGYARMICSRLQATTDPGLPETCGCPPMDWKGWTN